MYAKVWVYAFDKMHRIINTEGLYERELSISTMFKVADAMVTSNDEVNAVIAVDASVELHRDYRKAITNDFTARIEFEYYCATTGIILYLR